MHSVSGCKHASRTQHDVVVPCSVKMDVPHCQVRPCCCSMQGTESGVVKLSPEEGRKKAEDLMRKAKERREKEEKVSDVLREKERIRSGGSHSHSSHAWPDNSS